MGEMVRKAKAPEILNHWVLAGSFFLLTISGFGFLFHLEQLNLIFGSFNQLKIIHNWTGLVFAVSLFFTLFSYIPEALSFSSADMGWIIRGGGYFSKTVELPSQGKLNAGQKLYYLALLVLGSGSAVTGLIIWLRAGIKAYVLYSHLIHNISFDLMIIIVPLHIYLATLANPGTFRIMVYGTVPLEWATKWHGKWVKKIGCN